jgi:hypothetical protein
VYQEDLLEFPQNIWSLTGLKICYAARKDPRLATVELLLAVAVKASDTAIGASCLCALESCKTEPPLLPSAALPLEAAPTDGSLFADTGLPSCCENSAGRPSL